MTSPIDFTTIVALDEHHVREFEQTWPTWRDFRPEILQQPLLLACDGDLAPGFWNRRLSFLDHPDVRRVQWRMPGVPQREKMLTALTMLPATHVSTPWYLKLDTDTVATHPADWVRAEWFSPDDSGRNPVFIAQKWGFTKPADFLTRLEAWGDSVSELADLPRLDLIPQPGAARLKHPRITSWLFFGDTQWTKTVTALSPSRLPVPSHDTYLWYCAARRGDFFRRVRMTEHGWKHLGRFQSFQRHFEHAKRSALDASQTAEAMTPQEGIEAGASAAVPTIRVDERPTAAIARSSVARLSHGVVYLLSQTRHAVRLLVSIRSLRDYYAGPISVFSTDGDSSRLVDRIAEDPRLNIERRTIPRCRARRNAAYLTKISLLQHSPYDVASFLDADTLVVGNIDPLFELQPGNEIVATQFAHWTTTTSTIKRRIHRWRRIAAQPELMNQIESLVDSALHPRPAINVAFSAYAANPPWLNAGTTWPWRAATPSSAMRSPCNCSCTIFPTSSSIAGSTVRLFLPGRQRIHASGTCMGESISIPNRAPSGGLPTNAALQKMPAVSANGRRPAMNIWRLTFTVLRSNPPRYIGHSAFSFGEDARCLGISAMRQPEKRNGWSRPTAASDGDYGFHGAAPVDSAASPGTAFTVRCQACRARIANAECDKDAEYRSECRRFLVTV